MKRFSMREMTLLMAPVLLVGAAGWWASRRPAPPAKYEKLRLEFRIEKPTALEALQGANAAFVVKKQGTDAQKWSFQGNAPFLEVKTQSGIQTSRPNHRGVISWDHKLWADQTSNQDMFRVALKTSVIPAGPLDFGIYLPLRQIWPGTAPFKAPGLSGKWRIDRRKIPPLNLAAWPRKPLVSVESVVFDRVERTKNPRMMPYQITGKMVFRLDGATMNEKTSFDQSFSERHLNPPSSSHSIIYVGETVVDGPPATKIRRILMWIVSANTLSTHTKVSGRVSAGNRWPLGFEIEPFDFRSAKVGQKLRFKQGPVALPKS